MLTHEILDVGTTLLYTPAVHAAITEHLTFRVHTWMVPLAGMSTEVAYIHWLLDATSGSIASMVSAGQCIPYGWNAWLNG